MTLLLPDAHPPSRAPSSTSPPTVRGWRSGPGTPSSATRSSTAGPRPRHRGARADPPPGADRGGQPAGGAHGLPGRAAARSRGAARPEGREAQCRELVEAYDPDVVFRRDGDRLDAVERRTAAPTTCTPTSLLLSTSGSTGPPSWCGSPTTTCAATPRDRVVAADHRRRPGGHLAAAALLLWPLGREQPPRPGRRAGPHRGLRRRRVLLGALRQRGRDVVRRGAVHLRPPRPLRLRPARPARRCGWSPRPAAGSPSGSASRRAGSPPAGTSW